MKAKRVTFYCLLGLMAGCMPILSLNPLFTGDEVVFDEKLLGTWLDDANDPNLSWEFARFEESSAKGLREELQGEFKRIYRLNLFEKGQRKGALVACLGKLGDRRFLDVFPDQYPSGEFDPEQMKLTFNAVFFLRLHMLVRVDAIGDQLKIRYTDNDGLKKLLDADPKAVAHAIAEEGLVLTASTEELQAFVTKYADDTRLFAGEMTLVRKSK